MKIGVLGVGNVGSALGLGWIKAGHDVTFGSHNLGSDDSKELESRGAKVVDTKDAADAGDAIVFAVPYSSLSEVASQIGNPGDKILIDCMNPFNKEFTGIDIPDSVSIELAKATGSKRIVKCFNTLGFNIMQDPDFNGTPATMLYCGDDESAKKTAAQLAKDLGFAPIDAGPLSQARYMEHMSWLWVSLAMKYGQGREMAFILEKR